MIPKNNHIPSSKIPAGATFWMPTQEEYDDAAENTEGSFGYFRDTWMLGSPSLAEIAQMAAEEQNLLPLIDAHSKNQEEFESTVQAVESPDTAEYLPNHLKGTAFGDSLVTEDPGLNEPAFWGLEYGVSALSYALSSLGFIPVASCRAHHGTHHTWSERPVVLIATTRAGAEWLSPLLRETGCGFDLDDARPQFLVVTAPSVAHSIALAQTLIREAASAPTIVLEPASRSDEGPPVVPGQGELWQ